jgi:hypothetical protein
MRRLVLGHDVGRYTAPAGYLEALSARPFPRSCLVAALPGRAHAGATSASDAPDEPDAGLGRLSLGAANIVGQDDLRVLRHHRLDLAGKGFTHRLGPGGHPLWHATLDGAAVTAGRRP